MHLGCWTCLLFVLFDYVDVIEWQENDKYGHAEKQTTDHLTVSIFDKLEIKI